MSAHKDFLAGCIACVVLSLSLSFGNGAEVPTSRAKDANYQVLVVEGVVEVAAGGSSQWSAAKANQFLQPGDRLRTRENSRATLMSANEGRVRVRESSELILGPSSARTGRPLLNLLRGFFYFFNRGKSIEVELQDRVASATTRGTDFQVVVGDDGRVDLAVFDGEVDLENDHGKVTLAAGTAGLVQTGGRPEQLPGRVEAANLIQWCLYYHAILVPSELGLSAAEQAELKVSLAAYQRGDIPGALRAYPAALVPSTDAGRVYRAALMLAAGGVERAEDFLREVPTNSPMANALRQSIAAAQFRTWQQTRPPATASEWLAESHYRQSRASIELGALAAARNAAQAAVNQAPDFGLAWIRLAEMEFSFGRTAAALAALNRGVGMSPSNANAHATRGFLLSAVYVSLT